MTLGVAEHTSDDEAAALERLRQQDEQQDGTGESTDPGQQPAGAGSETSSTDTSTGTPAAGEDKPKGNVFAALRFARRSEERARQEAEKLREENERLKKANPQAAAEPASDSLTDQDIEAIGADFPALEKLAKTVKKVAEAAPATNATTTGEPEPEPEFEPPRLPPAVQEVVDTIPELSEWQHNPDQTLYQMADAHAAAVYTSPKWKDKPLAERLTEIVRRVKAEVGETGPSSTGSDPVQDAIDNAPSRQPSSPSEIGGGGGREGPSSDLARFQRMSAEEVEAELALRG